MKVLICGGGILRDASLVNAVLSKVNAERSPITLVIQGYQHGASWPSGQWAKARGIPVRDSEANWDAYGDAAGAIRDAEMIREGKPDLVVSFRCGDGTKNVRELAEAAGLEIIQR
jgi:hypothetical protein